MYDHMRPGTQFETEHFVDEHMRTLTDPACDKKKALQIIYCKMNQASSGLLPFYAHFLHSFRPFFTKTLDTVCVGKVTSARNVFKPDLERCKRESQEAQQLCGGLGNSVGNKLGNKKLLGNKGEGEQGPTVATQQDALSPIVDALQVLLVLVSDDVDHGAGEVGV